MRQLTSQRGIAMIVALFALVLVAGIGTLLFSRTLNEMRHSRDDAGIVQTLLLARAGSNVAGALLGNEVNVMLREVVRSASAPGPWVFGTGGGNSPSASSVISELTPIIEQLQSRVDSVLCSNAIVPEGVDAQIQLRLYFSSTSPACGDALPSNVSLPAPRFVSGPRRNSSEEGVQTYALPFVLVSLAESGDYRRNIVTQGEYRFEIGQANFAMWAYFTNREASRAESGTWYDKIYFTDQTMIDGPVHTNGRFAFAYDPWFGGSVSSAGCNNANCTSTTRGAHMLDYTYRGSDLIPDTVLGQTPSFGGNTPIFTQGVSWDSPRIAMPENNTNQRDVAQGDGRADEGLYFNSELYSLQMFAGTTATWNGNVNSVTPQRNSNGEYTPAATYQYIRACTSSSSSSCTVYRYDATGMVEIYDATRSRWNPRSSGRPFNGVVYVNGAVNRFTGPSRTSSGNSDTAPPALASFAQITLASDHDIRLTGDLKYENPPCQSIPTRNANRTVNEAQCTNTSAQNVLGIYTQSGNILVGHGHPSNQNRNAPNNVVVHAVLMSAEQEIRVENNTSGNSGNFYLMGGMIQERRGIFGWVTQARPGYDRVFTYDPRMSEGLAPPFFPSTGVDDVGAVTYFTYGQREQLYD